MSTSKVFISHSKDGTRWTKSFADELSKRGVSSWVDEWNVKPGEKLSDAIDRALRESETVVFVLSPRAVESKALFWELGAAVALGKRIIAVISEDLERSQVPVPLLQTRYLIQGPPDEAAEEVARAVA